MGNEPPGPFITSILELKLDPGTMFEGQDLPEVPHLDKLLEFLNLHAHASEVAGNGKRPNKNVVQNK